MSSYNIPVYTSALSSVSSGKKEEKEEKEEKSGPSSYILPIFSILLVLFFLAILIIYLYVNNESPLLSRLRTNQNEGLDTSTPIPTIPCPPGECITDLLTGVKTCPETDEEVLNSIPGLQVCNPPESCTSPMTPFAVQPNYSTRSDGICPAGITCRCSRNPQCSRNVATFFEGQNGNTYQNLGESFTTLSQTYSYIEPGGRINNTPPFVIDRLEQFNSFCSIPLEWMSRTYPAVNLENSPCVKGNLAFIPAKVDGFNLDRAQVTPVACMISSPCNRPDQSAVWDDRINSTVCVELCGVPGCETGTESFCERPIYDNLEGRIICEKYNE